MVVTYFRGRRLLEGGEEGREDHIIWCISMVDPAGVRIHNWATYAETDARSQVHATRSHQGTQSTDEAMSSEVGRSLG